MSKRFPVFIGLSVFPSFIGSYSTLFQSANISHTIAGSGISLISILYLTYKERKSDRD